ncbi:hypothetical protein SDC9_190104 [bioreactor metagenome]|uniref:Uncharacterized protein n=1 Tax=bioreactor metagenome TaxID=1076179 RepID=A0A645HU96_9ZZZZ
MIGGEGDQALLQINSPHQIPHHRVNRFDHRDFFLRRIVMAGEISGFDVNDDPVISLMEKLNPPV